MQLSRLNAEIIVKEINTIINKSVNMMNEEGVIIASTDPDRIGQIHQAARKIIDQQLEELLVKPEDDYEGSLEGVNYPIKIFNEVIGVVGITGACDEVSKYGQITKKMTEILMQEISMKEQKAIDENLRSRFVGEWLQNENVLINQSFVERGRRMQLDIMIPRRILVLAIFDADIHSCSMDKMRIVEITEQKVKDFIKHIDPNNIYMKSASNLVCGVSDRTDKEMLGLALNVKKVAEQQTDVRIAIGIDDKCHPYTMSHVSYTKACKALQSCLRAHKYDIRFYKDINLGIFTDEISDLSKKEYIQRLFSGYSSKELAEAMGLLETLYEAEGSIKAASTQLHMHKNTLQYKLKKIYDRTGHDPRSLKSSSLFYVAIDFYQEIRDLIDGE